MVKRSRSGLVILLPLLFLLLASCSNPFGGNNGGGQAQGKTPGASATALSLASLRWCGSPSMLFRDDGALPSPTAATTATPAGTSTPTGGTPTATATVTATSTATATTGAGTPRTITSWDVVMAGLGFTVFLPAALPAGTCLVSAQATVHDPTLGGSFLIGYLLSDHTSLSISEAPLLSQSTTFQCNASSGSTQKASAGTATATPTPLQICSGAKDTTHIVLSAQRSVEYVQQLFAAFQPGITWIPRA